MHQPVREFAWFLAGATLIPLPLFVFASDSQVARFAKVTPTIAVVVLLITALGLLAAQRAFDKLAVAAATIAAVAACGQLVQIGRATNLLGGNASSFAFLLALSLGWGGIAWAMSHPSRAGSV